MYFVLEYVPVSPVHRSIFESSWGNYKIELESVKLWYSPIFWKLYLGDTGKCNCSSEDHHKSLNTSRDSYIYLEDVFLTKKFNSISWSSTLQGELVSCNVHIYKKVTGFYAKSVGSYLGPFQIQIRIQNDYCGSIQPSQKVWIWPDPDFDAQHWLDCRNFWCSIGTCILPV